MMAATNYVILRLVSGGAEKVGIDGSWDRVDGVEAHSAEAAIRTHVAQAKTTGTFVAIPERSWKPTPVTVETQTVVKVGA
jgi:hypothetical protein